ncbi:GpE family phage tail protein [uncultured Sphingomonas sp.]|nr:GpE family phage tail protein [uncultured Sphingomonas sp.]
MADIAFVFHWQPDALNALSVADLMQWRERAARRHNPEGK